MASCGCLLCIAIFGCITVDAAHICPPARVSLYCCIQQAVTAAWGTPAQQFICSTQFRIGKLCTSSAATLVGPQHCRCASAKDCLGGQSGTRLQATRLRHCEVLFEQVMSHVDSHTLRGWICTVFHLESYQYWQSCGVAGVKHACSQEQANSASAVAAILQVVCCCCPVDMNNHTPSQSV